MEVNQNQECPVCYKEFPSLEIQLHVNKCLFLSSNNSTISLRNNLHTQIRSKRKKSASPELSKPNNKQHSSSYTTVIQDSYSTGLSDSGKEIVTNFKFEKPLSTQLQPKSLKEFFGQNHAVGKNTLLGSLLEENEIPNLILWGPPGCGKTSLANIIHEICKKNPKHYKYVGISAVESNVDEIRAILNNAREELKSQRRTVVFIDEIHTFNKKQQNAFAIPLVKAEIILIGATTENPSFALKNTFLNHCKVIVMNKLESSAVVSIIEKALKMLNVYILDDTNTLNNMWLPQGFKIHRSAVEWLADTSDGDARIALNNLQLILQHTKKEVISILEMKRQVKKSHLMYDRNGEEHHNIISAMHESIKGCNDNATLYWTTRMIAGGEDPLFIARRLVRTSSEDTGNKDPRAFRLALSTMQACQMIEAPESDILLTQCAIYLARAPTDKQLKTTLALAKEFILKNNHKEVKVPLHLKNIPPKLMLELIDADHKHRSFMPAGFEDVNFL